VSSADTDEILVDKINAYEIAILSNTSSFASISGYLTNLPMAELMDVWALIEWDTPF